MGFEVHQISLLRVEWVLLYTAGLWAAMEYPDADVRCYNFACPRVGNKAFCRQGTFSVKSWVHVCCPQPSRICTCCSLS